MIMHFSDNSLCPPRGHAKYNKLYKIRSLIIFSPQKMFSDFITNKHICVDDSLHFTGRLGIKLIPSKRGRYGVKLYTFCERVHHSLH